MAKCSLIIPIFLFDNIATITDKKEYLIWSSSKKEIGNSSLRIKCTAGCILLLGIPIIILYINTSNINKMSVN